MVKQRRYTDDPAGKYIIIAALLIGLLFGWLAGRAIADKLNLNAYHPHIRYFAIPAEHVNGHYSELVPDGDVLTLDVFRNSLQCGVTDSGRVILSVLFEPETLEAIAENTGQTELNQTVLDMLDINDCFAGRTFADVITKYPEMAGNTETVIDGETILIPRLTRKSWAVEYEVTE